MNTRLFSRKKAIVVVSDDWGMCAWCPTVSIYEEMRTLEYMRNAWSSGTLEAPADMERLFLLLEQFRGGDDLPALFMPMCIVGSPDFAAIEESGFTDYVDLGIDDGVPRGWSRGDLAAKAREGISRGVWHPGYHARAHHFSPQGWMERLRAGDEWAHHAFQRNVYVCETVRDRLPEFARTREDEQPVWVREGLIRFERAFGFSPRTARNSDLTPTVIDVLVENGVRAITDEGPLKASDGRLIVLSHLIQFEPFMTADHEDIVARTLSDMETAWASGQPAVLSSHRRNYKGFDAGDVERNFGRLRALLEAVSLHHPDAIYLCGDEVAQLSRQAYSVVRRGNRIICRNYGADQADVTVDAAGGNLELTLPRGELTINLEAG